MAANPAEGKMDDTDQTPIVEPVDKGNLVFGEFEVYTEVLPKLIAKLDKLIARAKRLGLDPIVYEVGEVEDRIYVPEDTEKPKIPYQIRKVFIVGTPPKINGWTFVGKLEHTDSGENLVSHMNKDIELPARYRTAPPWCEHCGKTRKRSLSYVLHSDDSRYFQVGKSCLADFLGRGDPGALAEVASLVQLAIEAGEAFTKGRGGPPDSGVFALDDFLAVVFQDIAERGWVGKSSKELPTAVVVWDHLKAWRDAPPEKSASFRPAPEFYAQAAEAAAWARSIPMDTSNDFERNLGVIARLGTVSSGQASRAVWIAHSRQATSEREVRLQAKAAEEASRAKSRHVGTVGQKTAAILHVDRVIELGRSSFGYGGTRYLLAMRDDEGNQFTWITTGLPRYEETATNAIRRLDQATTHAATCTVKEHGQYKGVAQTTVERCSFGPAARKAVGDRPIASPVSANTFRVLEAATKGPLWGVGRSMYDAALDDDDRTGYVATPDKPTTAKSPIDKSKTLPLESVYELINYGVLAPVQGAAARDAVMRPLSLTAHGWAEAVRLGLVASAPELPKRKGKPAAHAWASEKELLVQLARDVYSEGGDQSWYSKGNAFRHAVQVPGKKGTTMVFVPADAIPLEGAEDATVNRMIESGLLRWVTTDKEVSITPEGLLAAWDAGVVPVLSDEELLSIQKLHGILPVMGSVNTPMFAHEPQVFKLDGNRQAGTFPLTLLSKRMVEHYDVLDEDGSRKGYGRRLSALAERVLRESIKRNPTTGELDVQLSMVAREYEVSESHIGVLTRKLDALMKKAEKLKLGMFVYEVGPLERKTVHVDLQIGRGRDEYEVFFHRVMIVGKYPVINGWRIVAKLLHTDEGNIVVAFDPASKVPERFRKSANVCEHCGLTRKRIQTFVLMNEQGQFKQVGSDCLGDFVGYGDPAAMYDPYVLLMEALLAAESAQGESDEDSEGSGGSTVDLGKFLTWVAMAADNVGWRGRKAADMGNGVPTVDAAIELMLTCSKEIKAGGRGKRPDPKQEAKAKAALEWAKAIPESESDEFLLNLATIAKLGYVQPDTMGLAAWIVRAYEKTLELASKAETSGWMGKVGDTIVVNLKLLRSIQTAGHYGVSYGHVFADAQGNEAIWWTTSRTVKGKTNVELAPGTVVTLACTVKEQSERKGVKQTVLTRCNVAPEGWKPGVVDKPKGKKKITPEMGDILAHAALFGGGLVHQGSATGEKGWNAKGLYRSLWTGKEAAVTALRSLELLEATKAVERGKPDLRLTAAGLEAAKPFVAAHKALLAQTDALSLEEMRGLRESANRLQRNDDGSWSLYKSSQQSVSSSVVDSLLAKGLLALIGDGVEQTDLAKRLAPVLQEAIALRTVDKARRALANRPDIVDALRKMFRISYDVISGHSLMETLGDRAKWIKVEIPSDVVPTLTRLYLISKQWGGSDIAHEYARSSSGEQFLLSP